MAATAGGDAGQTEVNEMMPASPGDRIVVHAAQVGGRERDGEVVAAQGEDGGPPYLVRWSDTGAESLYFPGPDSEVHHDDSTGT